MTVRAAVDLGTVSTRCLIDDGGTRRRVERITRMGEGLVLGGGFAPEALDRVDGALADIGDRLGESADVVVVATEAARRAGTVEPLRAVVERRLGVPLRVLASADEGRLAFAGARRAMASDGAFLVVDIGGGSTEFTVGSAGDGVLGTYSAPIGALGITEQFLHHDPPRPDELSAALSVIELHLDDAVREVPVLASVVAAGGPAVVVGGTAITAAAVEIGLAVPSAEGVDGFELERSAAEDVFRTLATEIADDRAHNPGLAPGRVEVIVGGLCILVEVLRTFGLPSVVVSAADLLDGLVEEMAS